MILPRVRGPHGSLVPHAAPASPRLARDDLVPAPRRRLQALRPEEPTRRRETGRAAIRSRSAGQRAEIARLRRRRSSSPSKGARSAEQSQSAASLAHPRARNLRSAGISSSSEGGPNGTGVCSGGGSGGRVANLFE